MAAMVLPMEMACCLSHLLPRTQSHREPQLLKEHRKQAVQAFLSPKLHQMLAAQAFLLPKRYRTLVEQASRKLELLNQSQELSIHSQGCRSQAV